ncbi:MAG TPA: mannonate dehydratase [Prolixibacteraceae bacterium]|nr:mannonate dehydratase [Prolixibacteraceae bacterium]
MKLSLLLPPKYDERKWTLARQVGIKYVITKAMPELSGKKAPYHFDALQSIQTEFREAGFELYGLEGDQFDMTPIKLGLPGRDDLIEKYKQMIRNMSQLGIPLLCYNFMAVTGWYRSKTDVQERGGALTSEFNIQAMENDLVAEELRISEEKLWDNLFYFLDAVMPVAEAYGVKMALHPDDPPISPFRGVGRILTSAEAYEKILARYPGPSNGIAFCQATFKTMKEDLKGISEKWIRENKIFFIHLRDIAGDVNCFHETFIDNGPTPMAEMIKHYRDCGFDGIIRSDHAPAMYGETHQTFQGGISAGYDMLGHLFAVGYIKGICESGGITLD